MIDIESANFALAASCPFGKCTAEAKTVIPETSDELLVMLASAHRKTKSEYLRDVILEHLHGKAEIIRLRLAPPVRSAG
ncbi:MAG TPA: hypothetical protein VIR56_01995 [Solimonas sp.]